MPIALHGCSVCGERFEVQYGFQIQSLEEGVLYFCSQRCHEKSLYTHRRRVCSVCCGEFELRYAFQQVTAGSSVRFFCTTGCRSDVLSQARSRNGAPQAAPASAAAAEAPAAPDAPEAVEEAPPRGPARIAVLNQKGGTGKTTTAVHLAAGLAELGYHTLLLDLDAQGHVATSLGALTNHGVYQLMVEKREPRLCLTQLRKRLHAFVGDERLANVELWLARMGDGAETILRERLSVIEQGYDAVIIDCGPALSLLNINALTYADHVLVPVSCDFLSLVGVKQMLRTLDRVNRKLRSTVDILGIVPTFYDRRNRISDEAVKTLKGYFRDKVLPPIRINTRLKEAPQHKQTIFEYAPDSSGARDYRTLVEWVIGAVGMPSHAAPCAAVVRDS